MREGTDDDRVYFVKWTGHSFIHCPWVSQMALSGLSGGDVAVEKFQAGSKSAMLTQSLSLQSLPSFGADDVNSVWWNVDRVIGHRDDGCFFVKWCGQGYDQCSWEDEADVLDKAAVARFLAREDISHPTRIGRDRRYVRRQDFSESGEIPTDAAGTTLRDYQLQGFNWLRYCWYTHCNSILADEMGLGKTLQVVAMLGDLATREGIGGPFLVIAPLSTLPHWKNEFEPWSGLYPVVYHGPPTAKEIIKEYGIELCGTTCVAFNVLITNYETFLSDFDLFLGIEWRYLALDEGHRLKNHTGKCYNLLKQLTFKHCRFCVADIDQIFERRSTTLTHQGVAADSVFSKVKFDAEGDDLELNSKDFWTQAMS
jgi:chromodomain-helicase-DNA-binding protein 7